MAESTDDPPADSGNSTSVLVESLAALMDEESEQEFRATIDRLTDGDHAKIDAAATAGFALGDRVLAAQGTAHDGPPIHATEVVDEDGGVQGLRTVIDLPPSQVDPYFAQDAAEALFRTPEGEVTLPLPADIDRLSWVSEPGDAVTELYFYEDASAFSPPGTEPEEDDE